MEELQKELERVVKAAGASKEAQKLSEHATATFKKLSDSVKEIDEQVALEENPTEDRKFLKLAIEAEREFDYDEVIKNLKLSLSKKKDQPKQAPQYPPFRRLLSKLWTFWKDKKNVESSWFSGASNEPFWGTPSVFEVVWMDLSTRYWTKQMVKNHVPIIDQCFVQYPQPRAVAR